MTQTIIKVPATGGSAFDPTDIVITDNTSGAFLIKDDAGSPHEYMRIDTTTGQEKTIFKTQSGANTGFFVNVPTAGDVFSVVRGGSPATKCAITTGVTLLQVDSDKILNDLISDAKTFKVDGTNVAPLTITGDSNTTFTLDTGNNALFKVQDNLGSPTQFLTIDSNTASESIKLALTPANADRFFEMTSSKIHARCQNSQIQMGVGSITLTAYDDFTFNMYAANKKLRFMDAQNAEERFSVDKESNATFTLDDGTASVFKVVDNGSSPYTYLSATEGENAVRMSALRTDSSGLLQFQNTSGGLFFQFYQNSYIEQSIQQRHKKTVIGPQGSNATDSRTIDLRLGGVSGLQHYVIDHNYSGTQTFTLNFNNSLSQFAGNHNWGVNSLIVIVENATSAQDVALQIRESVGGVTTFIDHTGASLSNPTGSGSLTLKNLGAASGKNFITFRVSQFNNGRGSASIYDDDRYIVEALTAELF